MYKVNILHESEKTTFLGVFLCKYLQSSLVQKLTALSLLKMIHSTKYGQSGSLRGTYTLTEISVTEIDCFEA